MSDLHRELDAAFERVKGGFGQAHPMFVNGRAVEGARPRDRRPEPDRHAHPHRSLRVGHARAGAGGHRRGAGGVSGLEPASLAGACADRPRIGRRIRERRADLSALVGYETGKSRLECVGEVEEAADFFDYYCDRMEQTDGFENLMGMPGSADESRSVLRPFGVFGIIAPFNFPVALAAGPTAAALLAGNTIVCKAAEDTGLAGIRFYEVLADCSRRGSSTWSTAPACPWARRLPTTPVWTDSYLPGRWRSA